MDDVEITSPVEAPEAPAETPANPLADKRGRIPFPALQVDEDGNPTQLLTELPGDDFDSEKHQPLKRSHFKAEYLWFELKAIEADAKAAEYREKAEEAKKLGDSEDRAKKKKLLMHVKKQQELIKQLKAGGTDVDALLASIQGESEE